MQNPNPFPVKTLVKKAVKNAVGKTAKVVDEFGLRICKFNAILTG
jgi:hypothetical protein